MRPSKGAGRVRRAPWSAEPRPGARGARTSVRSQQPAGGSQQCQGSPEAAAAPRRHRFVRHCWAGAFGVVHVHCSALSGCPVPLSCRTIKKSWFNDVEIWPEKKIRYQSNILMKSSIFILSICSILVFTLATLYLIFSEVDTGRELLLQCCGLVRIFARRDEYPS